MELGIALITLVGVFAAIGVLIVVGMQRLIADIAELDELDHLEQRKGAQRDD